MRRYVFYITVAVLAFGTGSFLAFQFYWKTQEKKVTKEETNIVNEAQPEEPRIVGFGTGEGSRRLDAPEYVPVKKKVTCRKKELLPVWKELKKDKIFRENEQGFYMEAGCTEMLDVKKLDLNGDGRKEFVLWGKNGNLCGATGNCLIWIYEKNGDRYKLLLQSSAYRDGEEEWFEVKKKATSGYRDLLLKTHFSAYETTHESFKFNGVRYVENKCWFEIYSMGEETPSTMSCKEYSAATERQARESEEKLKKQ